jgi:hypothetical protein
MGMRMRINIVITSIMLGLLLLPAAASTSSANTSIKVIPASIDVSVGEEFSVDIVLEPGGDEVYGVQYELTFDTASLKFVSQTAGDFLSQDGANTIEVVNGFSSESQKLEYGETRMGVETGVTAAGTLAHITFRVTGDRGSYLDFTEVIVGAPTEGGGKELPVSVENGICLVDGVAPTSTPEPTATATRGGTPAPAATMIETATPTPEPESMPEETSTHGSTPSVEQPAGNPEPTRDSTPAEHAGGFGVITTYAGILIISFALKRRRYK